MKPVVFWLIDGWRPLAIAGVLYVCQAAVYWRKQDYGLALAFIGYALANVGFIYSLTR